MSLYRKRKQRHIMKRGLERATKTVSDSTMKKQRSIVHDIQVPRLKQKLYLIIIPALEGWIDNTPTRINHLTTIHASI